jgi:hypothetical protein
MTLEEKVKALIEFMFNTMNRDAEIDGDKLVKTVLGLYREQLRESLIAYEKWNHEQFLIEHPHEIGFEFEATEPEKRVDAFLKEQK